MVMNSLLNIFGKFGRLNIFYVDYEIFVEKMIIIVDVVDKL